MKTEAGPRGASTGTIATGASRGAEFSARSFSAKTATAPSRPFSFTSISPSNERSFSAKRLGTFTPLSSPMVNEGPVKNFNLKNTTEFSTHRPVTSEQPVRAKRAHRSRPRISHERVRNHGLPEVVHPRRVLPERITEIPSLQRPLESDSFVASPKKQDGEKAMDVLRKKTSMQKVIRFMPPEDEEHTERTRPMQRTKTENPAAQHAISLTKPQRIERTSARITIPELTRMHIATSLPRLQSVNHLSQNMLERVVRIHAPVATEKKAAVITIAKSEASTAVRTELLSQPTTRTEAIVVFKQNIETARALASSEDEENLKHERDIATNTVRENTMKKIWHALTRKFADAKSRFTGKDLSIALPSDPSETLLSELIRKRRKKVDGSYKRIKKELAEYEKIDDVGAVAKSLVEKYTAVRAPKPFARNQATPKEVALVLESNPFALDQAA